MSDDWLPELRKDIPYFHELGINAIHISHSDITKNARQALQLLQNAGIHVLLTLLTGLRSLKSRTGTEFDNASDPIDLQRIYNSDFVLKTLTIVDQTADFENVLGYSLDFEILGKKGTTRIASLHRAAVRDVKHYLSLRGGRQVHVGASLPALLSFWGPGLEYMAAGEPSERIDFLGFDCYSWVATSDFKISGYQDFVKSLSNYPLPMFFSEYGARMGQARGFDEVECLFSPDMTGVFSGGFVETYSCSRIKPKLESEGVDDTGPQDSDNLDANADHESRDISDHNSNDEETAEEGSDMSDDVFDDDQDEDEEEDDVGGYDLMRVAEDGTRQPKRDFWNYKTKLDIVSQRSDSGIFSQHERKDYENWRGNIPGPSGVWLADPEAIPSFPLEWNQVLEALGRNVTPEGEQQAP